MYAAQLYHISLGLVYLHSHKIIHGDLKAVSIADLLVILVYSDMYSFSSMC